MAINQFISIREVIFMYSEAAKQDDTKFLRLWRIAFRGYLQLGLGHFFATQKVTLPINENKTVSFPDDQLQWLDIQPVEGSYIREFIKTNKICKDNEYTVDVTNQCFNFHTDISETEIVLTYVYTPEVDSECSEYVIPIQFTESLMDWISWQDVKHIPVSSHFGRGDKNDKAMAFRASLKLAKALYKPFKTSDATQSYK